MTSGSVIVAGVDDQRVVGGPQRRHRACRIQVVTPPHIRKYGLEVVGQAGRHVLVVAPSRPLFGRSGQEDLHIGIGQHDGADVTALDHDAAGPRGEFALQPYQTRPDGGHRRHRRHRLGDLVAADLTRNILCVKVSLILVGVIAHRQRNILRGHLDGRGVGQVDAGPEHCQRHDSVHRAGIQISRTE